MLVDVCFREPFDDVSLSVAVVVIRFVGGVWIKPRRDEDDTGVVWIEASFKRLIIGRGDGDRGLLRYWSFGKLITTFWSDEDGEEFWEWRSKDVFEIVFEDKKKLKDFWQKNKQSKVLL